MSIEPFFFNLKTFSMRFIIFISILLTSFLTLDAQRIITKSTQKSSFVIPTEDIIDLKRAPSDAETTNKALGIPLTFSLPNGESVRYNFLKNEVMSLEMKTTYPEIATFTGYSESLKSHIVSLTLHNNKIHAFILGANENAIMIDQVVENEYESTYGERTETFECNTDHSKFRPFMPSGARTSTNGTTLKNYAFAVVITDEYEAGNGGGAAAIAVALATINDISAIYKRDLAVTFTATIRPETSSFDIVPAGPNPDYGGTCVAAYFSSSEYDLGQLFHKTTSGGGSGVAYVGVVCNNILTPPYKSRSWSQAGTNVGYGFLSIVAHEMAHMFSASHSFNSNTSGCGPQRSNANSYEPGGGTTFMAYPGVCAGENITDQSGNIIYSSSPYFHVRSLEQMVSFITSTAGNSCASGSSTSNSPPVAIANPCNATSITIPANTPFELTGSHTDSDGDAITYNWEQYNPGPPHGAPNIACGSTTGPIFRSYPPSTSPIRYFPSLTYILNNSNTPPFTTIGECLPTGTRTLDFRLTVRDNNANGGGIDVSAIQLSVSSTSGPLALTSPNTGVTLAAGSNNTITWSGSNTSSICSTVNIKLSVDGGQTFPYSLATNTANDGTQSVTLPSNLPPSSTCRIKVESSCFSCVKFFDISNVNFTITSSCLVSSSNICNNGPITANQNDPSLNMSLEVAYGSSFSSRAMTTSGSAVFSSLHSGATPQSGSCTSLNFNDRAATFQFKPNQTGIYSFNMSGGFAHASVYLGAYTASQPCTNFLSSSAYNSGNITNPFTITLNECATYTVVFFDAVNTSGTMSISGPSGSTTYLHNPLSNPDYAYTFLAVNSTNNIITAISSTASFSTLSAGNYHIYGLHYYSGTSNPPGNVNPNNYIGQSLTSISSSSICALLSENFKPITITGACTPLVTSSANSGPGTLRDIAGCAAEGAAITLSSGINPLLTSALVIDKNLTIDGNVNGSNQPITEITLNFSGSYGIKINPSKTVTFKDLKVNMTSTASPVVLNEGNLTLNNAEIKGNVDPIVNNVAGSTINVSNAVTIKK